MNRKSLGLIETIGLAAGIEAADAAVKSANVELIGYELTRGDGMATIKVEGDVGAVKAAVSAAEAAARKVGGVFSSRVIARPAQGLESLVRNADTVGIKPATGKGPDGPGGGSPGGGKSPDDGSGPSGGGDSPTTAITEAPKAEKPVVPAPEQQAKPPVVTEKPKPPAKEMKPVVKDTSTPAEPEAKPAAEPAKEDTKVELEEAKPPVKNSKPAGKEPQTPAKPKTAKQEKKATKKSPAKGKKNAPKQPKGQAKPDAPKEKKQGGNP